MTCQNCGAPIGAASDKPVACPFCHAVNEPPPKEVPVPVPVQVVNQVVQVMGSAEAFELRCPHCRRKLATVRVSGVDLNGCGACGGIWIDNAGAQHVLAAPEEVFAELATRAARNAKHVGMRAPKPVCAACPSELDRVMAPNVAIELDVCAQHGTWFDAHELAQLVHALTRPKTKPIPRRDATECVGCHT